MISAVDKNQLAGSHETSNSMKHKQIEMLGYELRPIPLPFGDYCLVTEQMRETINRRGHKLKKADLVGDIKISVDTKKDLLEVCRNICGKNHDRFRDELILAQKCGCKLYILIEETRIKSVQDIFRWQNPRINGYNKIKYMHSLGKWQHIPLPKSPPVKGTTLAKAMLTMEKKYGVAFCFTKPENAGSEIVRLLTGLKIV